MVEGCAYQPLWVFATTISAASRRLIDSQQKARNAQSIKEPATRPLTSLWPTWLYTTHGGTSRVPHEAQHSLGGPNCLHIYISWTDIHWCKLMRNSTLRLEKQSFLSQLVHISNHFPEGLWTNIPVISDCWTKSMLEQTQTSHWMSEIW